MPPAATAVPNQDEATRENDPPVGTVSEPDASRRARMRQLIAGAVAEVDPAQMAITRTLTPAQRFQQMLSMIDFVEGIAAYRLRQSRPELSETEALCLIRRHNADL